MTAMTKRNRHQPASAPTTSRPSAPTSRSCSARSTASRSSISTTAPRRRSRARCSTPSITPTRWSTPTSIAACTSSPTPPPPSFEDARETVRRFLNAPSADEIIFTRNADGRRSTWSPARFGMDFKEGDEIVLSIMEHHSNIVPWHFHRERKGCVLKWAPISDNGEFLLDEFEALLTKRTRMVAITHMSNVLGTVVPIKEVIRRRARPRHPRAGRRRAGRRAHAHRRAGPRLRLLRLHRPQDLRADRHRRALRQEEAPRRHAALPGRRRHDRERAHRPHHLRQAAAQVRGRHAADRAGDRARRRARLHDAGGARPHRRPRGRAQGLRARAARPAQLAQDPRAGQGQGRDRLVQRSTACTRTTSPPSSTARAWRCAPATTAPSR